MVIISSKKELYMKTIYAFGVTNQLDKVVEECSELIQAIQKFKQNRMTNVEEEIADVEIMCEQLRMMFNEEMINSFKAQKLDRLEKRVLSNERTVKDETICDDFISLDRRTIMGHRKELEVEKNA